MAPSYPPREFHPQDQRASREVPYCPDDLPAEERRVDIDDIAPAPYPREDEIVTSPASSTTLRKHNNVINDLQVHIIFDWRAKFHFYF